MGESDSVMMAVSTFGGGSAVQQRMFFKANKNLGAESRSRTCVLTRTKNLHGFIAKRPKCKSVKFSSDGIICTAHVISLAGWHSRLGNCTRLEGQAIRTGIY